MWLKVCNQPLKVLKGEIEEMHMEDRALLKDLQVINMQIQTRTTQENQLAKSWAQ
jgi:hypothetical protein